MKIRPTPNIIKIQNMRTGVFAPSVYVDGEYKTAVKHVREVNALVSRFPEIWIAY